MHVEESLLLRLWNLVLRGCENDSRLRDDLK